MAAPNREETGTHTFGKKVAMNFMQGTAIPLDQRSLDAFEIGLHHDPPLLLVHGQPMDSIRIALCSSIIVCVAYVCVCVCLAVSPDI